MRSLAGSERDELTQKSTINECNWSSAACDDSFAAFVESANAPAAGPSSCPGNGPKYLTLEACSKLIQDVLTLEATVAPVVADCQLLQEHVSAIETVPAARPPDAVAVWQYDVKYYLDHLIVAGHARHCLWALDDL